MENNELNEKELQEGTVNEESVSEEIVEKEEIKPILEEKQEESISSDVKEVSEVVEEPKTEEIKEEKQEPKKENKFGFLKLLWKIIKVFIILIGLLILAVIIVQRVSHNKASIAGYGIYTVVSESMVPEYNIWDMLFAKKTDAAFIEIGDDVVYQGTEGDFADRIVTHRVIKKTRHGNSYTFVTKGIANDLEDPEINEDQIYGKVVLKSTVLSLLSKAVNNEYGFYFIIFIPLVLIISWEVIDTANERKKLKRN